MTPPIGPISYGLAYRPKGTPASSDSSVQRHVLAINDNVDVLALFTELLEEEGYRVSTQVYVDKDLKAIEDLAPDLINLDDM